MHLPLASNSSRHKLHTIRSTLSHPITLCRHKPRHRVPVDMVMLGVQVCIHNHTADNHHLSTTVGPDLHISHSRNITTPRHRLTHIHHKSAISTDISIE